MSDTSMNYCPRCQIGICHPGTVTYVSSIQGKLFCAPDTPVYICDVCGYHEFKSESIRLMNRLIDDTDVDAWAAQTRTSHTQVEAPDQNKKPHSKP